MKVYVLKVRVTDWSCGCEPIFGVFKDKKEAKRYAVELSQKTSLEEIESLILPYGPEKPCLACCRLKDFKDVEEYIIQEVKLS